MPFKTRDFLLFITMVAFLLIGITTTVSRNHSSGSEGLVYNFSKQDDVTYEAITPELPPDGRKERLTDLRAKIAKLGSEQSISSKVAAEVDSEEVGDEESEEENEEEVVGGVQYCSNYTEINPAWRTDNLEFEIVEGARILYRSMNPSVVADTGSSSSVLPRSNREFVLQLPLRTQPVSVKNCIKTDVVGIALDGSLIRNNEHSLYNIFGASTLVGFALDGFPIYGNGGSLKTDSCGGKMVQGGYRYYLSTEREGVLGCYAGVPVRI